ncbi:hypothetical protein L1049_022929 [Liquidambar formosana]|uniref:Uncharacterized protein n=1 Tax=Liquidambar formosana TaxID=63359 RepID=A0AAP0WPB5_LIQFO
MDIGTLLIGLIPRLCNSIAKTIGYVVNLNQSVLSLATRFKELKDTWDDLKRRVDQAELEGLMRTNQVKGWLERVEAIEAEVGLLLDDFRERRQCLWCCRCKLLFEI